MTADPIPDWVDTLRGLPPAQLGQWLDRATAADAKILWKFLIPLWAEDLRGLPPEEREQWIETAQEQIGRSEFGHPEDERYRQDPESFAREILGSAEWSVEQRKAADIIAAAALSGGSCQILALGGNGTGKSYIEDLMTVWIWGPVSSQLDDDGKPQGCDVILTAPTEGSIERTSYHELLKMGRKAAEAGYKLAGWEARPAENYRGASTRSIKWEEGPWRMVGVNPKSTADKDVAHSAGGMHHTHRMVMRVEEGLGVPLEMLLAMKGLSAAGNVLTLAATNPTSMSGALYGITRANQDSWDLIEFSQISHPNVIARSRVVPGCIDHLELEKAMRSSAFEDRGPAEGASTDEARLDFVYALPPAGMTEDLGPREDGIPGHPSAVPHVFRPATAMAAGQHCGRWLESDVGALLFHVSGIATAMAAGLWREPDGEPTQVGIDCAQSRPPVACARWGPSAREAYDASLKNDEKKSQPGRPVSCSRPSELPWTDPTGRDNPNQKAATSARAVVERWGKSCAYVLDRAFGGEVGQALEKGLGCKVSYVEFGDPAVSTEIKIYGPALNRRAEIHMDAAAALNSGLVDMAHSEPVLEQMRAVGTLEEALARKGAKMIRKKKEIERDYGGPLDELDSVVLAMSAPAPTMPPGIYVYPAAPVVGSRPAGLSPA